MSTIRVSEEVEERLRELKRDDESFDDLLDRLIRSGKDVEAIAESLAEYDERKQAKMEEAHRELSESL